MIVKNYNLTVKVMVPICTFLVVLTIFTNILFYIFYKNQAIDISEKNGVSTIKIANLTRDYYNTNIVKKILNSKDTNITTSVNHKEELNTIPTPATFMIELSKLTQENNDKETKINFYSHFPFQNRMGRILNEKQEKILNFLNQNPQSTYKSFDYDNKGNAIVSIAKADIMQEACVGCHNSHPLSLKKDWKVGDMRGVFEVQIPITQMLAKAKQQIFIITLLIIGIIFLFFIIIYLIIRFGITEVFIKKMKILNSSIYSSEKNTLTVKELFKKVSEISLEQHTTEDTAISNLVHIDAATQETIENISHNIKLTNESEDEIKKIINTINELKQNVYIFDETSQELEEINSIIGMINSKALTINSIVSKTELLSLNASIESSRAGEYGKGFSVVAEEVGNLAKISGEAAHGIQALIKSSQDKVSKIIDTTKLRINQVIVNTNDSAQSVLNFQAKIESIKNYANMVQNSNEKQVKYILKTKEDINKMFTLSNCLTSIVNESEQNIIKLTENTKEIIENNKELTILIVGD